MRARILLLVTVAALLLAAVPAVAEDSEPEACVVEVVDVWEGFSGPWGLALDSSTC